jgi:uncharacterized protein with predicted RNA binding PUA domain
MDAEDRALLQRVATYQFGAGAGSALFPEAESPAINRTSSGRPRQVIAEDGRIGTYRRDGRLTLGAVGGRRLANGFDPPRHRVVVGEESEPYVRESHNAFSKFVHSADEGIRPGDEVLVVDRDDGLLAVGQAGVPGRAMLEFETGVAVSVRVGLPAEETKEPPE